MPRAQKCDLYVVRLLPEGRQIQGTKQRDPCRFGFSKPCVRCLRALDRFGVHRVIFSNGQEGTGGEAIGCEVCEVEQLLEAAVVSGHCSRGDQKAVASGAVRDPRFFVHQKAHKFSNKK